MRELSPSPSAEAIELSFAKFPGTAKASCLAQDPLLESFEGLEGRVGILGGSFDPVHTGHIAAARSLREQLNLDYMVLVPAHQNPLKEHAPKASDIIRLELLREALRTEPGLYVSPIELPIYDVHAENPQFSYTAETLRRVRGDMDEKSELLFCLGSDAVPGLHRWYRVDDVFELCTLVPYARAGYPLEENQNLSDFQQDALRQQFRTVPRIELSSTEIRSLVASGAAVPEGALPEQIVDRVMSVYR